MLLKPILLKALALALDLVIDEVMSEQVKDKELKEVERDLLDEDSE